MSTSNYPTSEVDNTPQKKSPKNLIIVLMAVGLVASLCYLVIDGNKTSDVIEQNHTQIAKISDDKSTIQKSFDESLVRLDSMSGISNGMRSKLKEENAQIVQKKAEIRRILITGMQPPQNWQKQKN